MSVKYEQPLDGLTVQVWLLYDHPNFKYCTLSLFASGTELRTDRRMDDLITSSPKYLTLYPAFDGYLDG